MIVFTDGEENNDPLVREVSVDVLRKVRRHLPCKKKPDELQI